MHPEIEMVVALKEAAIGSRRVQPRAKFLAIAFVSRTRRDMQSGFKDGAPLGHGEGFDRSAPMSKYTRGFR